MWNYGSPAFADASPPRLLRQLCKLDARSGVQLPPHSKVVALAVSAGGRVLWSAGKNTISLWSTHSEFDQLHPVAWHVYTSAAPECIAGRSVEGCGQSALEM
jgi:hypothetical protein